ncbi:hypothetical protein PHYSODRAFT_326193 [Phytophthora sojae]|uniref:Uncharacterized protein n=1 Tax=Phytophthora sojae (strain P6497) TaxID=1094619 RepID=G4YYK9_PHYSP|nr:hypothetical protein PHYSODRAFT_326193 [Phytophthora sojae]EGZ25127.1 hypothetical protein PHYSODRAFT_326193 [Phytophthora sojae]|eukprot:XP_009520415.1 hypothetical protein PHYSODRAFT_326193 [Phytophthora sojae]
METRRRALVKITLGWEQAYEFEMWIIDHSAGVDVVLGMDFMIPAGIRLDLFHGTARLPDEVMVPLLKSQSDEDDQPYRTQPSCGPTDDLYVPGREWREFRLPSQRLPPNDLWASTGAADMGTTHQYYDRNGTIAKHDSVVLWEPHGELPRETGYARLDSNKYKEWQVLLNAAEDLTETAQRSNVAERSSSRVSQGSVKVTDAGAEDTERDGVSNDGSDDETSALVDSDTLEGSSLHRAAYASKRTDHNAYSIEHGAQEAPAEVSGAGDKRDDGVGELNDDSGEDHDAPEHALNQIKRRLRGATVLSTGVNMILARLTFLLKQEPPRPRKDPGRLLEANYTSVVHAVVAEGLTEDDDTANDVKLSDYAQESLPTPRLKLITRIWPYLERGKPRHEC